MPSPETIYLGTLVLVFSLLVLSIRNPFYGLLSYFTVMITRIGLYFPILGSIRIELIIGIIVLAEIVVFKKNLHRIKLAYNPVNKYLFLFLLVIGVSFIQAWDYARSWDYAVIEFIRIYIFFIMVLALVEGRKEIRTFLWAFAFLTIVVGYEGIYAYLSGDKSYTFQGLDIAVASKGFASGHVAAANMQLQCLPIMIYLILTAKGNLGRLGGAILAGSSFLAIIASGSRGGFLGLLFIGGLIVYFSKKRVVALLICVAILLASAPFMKGNYLSWMETAVEMSDESSTSRIGGLQNGIEMMMKRPFLGVGPGCETLARKAWFGWGLESHNHYGQLMGELGLIGTIVWFVFLYHLLKNLQTSKKILKNRGMKDLPLLITGMQIALFVRLFEGMGSHSLYIFFWYIMAALSVVLVGLSRDKYDTHEASDREIHKTHLLPSHL